MKRNLFFMIATLWGLNLAQGAPQTSSTRIAAVVNNKMISYTDLTNRIKLALISAEMPNNPEAMKEMQRQILNVMIEEKLQQILGDEFKIKIDDAMVDQSLLEIEKENNMAEGDFKKLLAANNVPLQTMKDHLRSSIIWREYIRERHGKSIQISDEEVKKALATQETQTKTTRFLMAEILIHINQDTPAPKAQAIAQRIRNQLENGNSKFASLAQQFSNAPSASRGGHIGWISSASMDEQLRKATQNMKAGELSQPIRTDNGYYIVLVRDRLEPGEFGKVQTIMSLKQIMLPHPSGAFEFEIQENMNRAANLSRSLSGCRMVDQMSKTKGMNVQNINDVAVENLPQDLRQLVGNLKEGQTSKPVYAENGAILFTVCKKQVINPEKPTEENIRANLLERKLQLIADREMRNRRLSAHIEIRP